MTSSGNFSNYDYILLGCSIGALHTSPALMDASSVVCVIILIECLIGDF